VGRKITAMELCFITIILLSRQTVQQNPGAATGAGVGAATGGVPGAPFGRGAEVIAPYLTNDPSRRY